ILFTLHGVRLVASAHREKLALDALLEVGKRFDALEDSIRLFEDGITPAEYLARGASEAQVWTRILDEYRDRSVALERTTPSRDAATPCVRRVEDAVRRMGELRGIVLVARSRSADVTGPEVAYHRE